MSSLAPAAQQHHPPSPVLGRVGIASLSGSTSLPAHVTPTSRMLPGEGETHQLYALETSGQAPRDLNWDFRGSGSQVPGLTCQ